MNRGKQINLIGKKIGKLTVISKAKSILGGLTVKRYWGCWNCQCDCGNEIIVKTTNLTRETVKSCGCLISLYGISLIPGQKINRLTTVSYKRGKWNCKCDCGNEINVTTYNLNNGNTKSCGCLKTDELISRVEKLISGKRKYSPEIASARRVWKRYCYRDNQMISFDDFYKLSQMNCYYCGIAPIQEYNAFINSARSSLNAKKNGSFKYNGLDRIDSNIDHIIENVVPCCYNCNRAKNNRSVKDFLKWILTLDYKEIIDPIKLDLPTGSLKTSIKCVFYNHKNDTDMILEEYYSISQMNCYYCGVGPSNLFNKAKTNKKSSIKAKKEGDYIYNGIDRLNSDLSHNKNNIVPCCKWCNFAKSNLTLNEFYEWISRIKQFQNAKT